MKINGIEVDKVERFGIQDQKNLTKNGGYEKYVIHKINFE